MLSKQEKPLQDAGEENHGKYWQTGKVLLDFGPYEAGNQPLAHLEASLEIHLKLPQFQTTKHTTKSQWEAV